MSDETKEKRQHEEHHPHHAHKHDHHGHKDEDRPIHMGWFLVIGAILIALVVLGWTMNM